MIKEGVLLDLDFSNFSICMDCARGKLIAKARKGKKAKKKILELIHVNIHIDICGLISLTTIGGFSNLSPSLMTIQDLNGWSSFLKSLRY